MIGVLTNIFYDLPEVIKQFSEAYEFFPEIFHCGWIVAVLLSIFGVVVVARNQIFIGAAITQTSIFSVSVALSILGLESFAHANETNCQGIILTVSILSASLCAICTFVNKGALFSILRRIKLPFPVSKESTKKHGEDFTGWLFLLSSAGTIVLLSKSPVGKELIDQLLFSNIIGAEGSDVNLLIILFLTTLVLLIFFLNKITLVFTDRDYSLAIHLPATRIEFIYSILAGISLGLCIKVSGTLYTFGCLVLPVIIAANLVKSVRMLFLISPIIAFVMSFIGFAAGNFYDIPQTQLTIFLMALVYPLSFLYKIIFGRN